MSDCVLTSIDAARSCVLAKLVELQPSSPLLHSSSSNMAACQLATQHSNTMEQAELLLKSLRSQIQSKSSGSLLLIGHRQSGIDECLQYVFSQLENTQELRNINAVSIQYVAVDGSIQRTELDALRHMCRQLNIDEDIEDGDRAHADERFASIYSVLRANAAANVPVVMILKEFDRYATRNNQGFLYNLLDLLHAHSIQLTILCCTSRVDAVELLEKRVRSRLSLQRIVFPRNISICHIHTFLQTIFSIQTCDADINEKYILEFNRAVVNLLNDVTFNNVVKQQIERGRSMQWFITVINMQMAFLNKLEPVPSPQGFIKCVNLLTDDFMIRQTQDLSVPELIMLVAMIRLEKRDITSYNFEMVYNEYKVMSHKGHDAYRLAKRAFFRSFERLMSLQFMQSSTSLIPSGMLHCDKHKRFEKVRLMRDIEDMSVAVSRCHNAPPWIKQWIQHVQA